MSNRTKSYRTYGQCSLSREAREARRAEHRAGWAKYPVLDSKFGARSPDELAEIRAALIDQGVYPGFGTGGDFLKVKPCRPDLEGWSDVVIEQHYPSSHWDDWAWYPNWPGDYVKVRLFTRTGQSPCVYLCGMDDTDAEQLFDTEADARAMIDLLIACQPLSRADFDGLGFRST